MSLLQNFNAWCTLYKHPHTEENTPYLSREDKSISICSQASLSCKAKLHTRSVRKVAVTALAFLAANLLGICLLFPASARAESIQTDSDGPKTALQDQSTTQMSSKPEVVYVSSVSDPNVRRQLFNDNWKFNLGEVGGAQEKAFNDSAWQSVTLPHDYSIDQQYSKNAEAESAYKFGGVGWYRKSFEVSDTLQGKRIFLNFDGVYMDATVYVNGSELGTNAYGYSPFTFDITDYIKVGETNVIAVRVNHQTPSSRWYSGSGIGRNVSLVVTNPIHIATHGVRVTTPKLKEESTAGFVSQATTHAVTRIQNQSDENVTLTLVQTVFSATESVEHPIGTSTSELTVTAKSTALKAVDIPVSSPQLWSVKSPALYTLRTEIKQGDQTLDSYDVDFGYRFIDYDANTGFSLNGEFLKIKGVCLHHDQGSLGSVDTEAALRRQVRLLKRMGCNSIRTSHNTPAETLVRICNEEGMLLDEEIFDGWTSAKNGNSNDFARFFNAPMGASLLEGSASDKTWAQFVVEQTIARDANAPAVIMWSLGNEMSEGTWGLSNIKATQSKLISWATAADSTRPVTTGDNRIKGGNAQLNPQGLADADGLVGINYASGSRYDQLHRDHPTWRIYGSEVASAINSRGIYNTFGTDGGTQQLTSYDWSRVNWGHLASEAWYATITRDFVAGEYVWTGFDYLGEPTPWNGVGPGVQGHWPSPKNSYFGIIDTAGLPKDSYYLYQSLWNNTLHTLHILPAWNKDVVKEDSNGKVPVVVYTDAPAVELFFTPKGSQEAQSLGRKQFTQKTTPTGHSYQLYEGDDKASDEHKNLYLQWSVPWQDGTLFAKAYDKNGQVIDTNDWDGRQELTTTGIAQKLAAHIDRATLIADGKDLAYITIDVTDAAGNLVPSASNVVKVSVEGSGQLAALDNGSAPDHQSYRDANRHAHAGQLVALVRAARTPGDIRVQISSDGLQSTELTIPAVAASANETSEKTLDSLYYARYYYVKVGNSLRLPDHIQVRYSDGSSEDKPVAWEQYDPKELDHVHDFEVTGTVAGTKVSAFVSMIDDVVALMSYSATTPLGIPAVLPTDRPGVLADATILHAAFPVTWQTPADTVYDKPGMVVLLGHAQVFGKNLDVSASIRVQPETVEIGSNVAAAASLSQNIPEDKQSDNLSAITDGDKTVSANIFGGPNKTCWTNYAYSQEGNTDAQITFTYATQQRLGKIVAYFAKDSFAARWPDANTTRFEVSEDGEKWTSLPVKETIGDPSGNVVPYSYEFAPTTATFVRMSVTNKDEVLSNRKPCTSLSEVELYNVQGHYTTHTQAALEALSVNGAAVPKVALVKGHYETPALQATLDPTPAENTAVTVLPVYKDAIRVLLESEDHTTRKLFTLNLGQEYIPTADDGSRDYLVEDMTFSTGSEHTDPSNAVEGLIGYAFDNNEDTYYHSHWSGAPTENLWVQMDLKEPASIDALRYLARPAVNSGSGNGVLTEAKLQYSLDGKTWLDAKSVSWPSPDSADYKREWRLLTLDEPVAAQHFRLQTIHSYATNGADKYMSAAEIRLRRAIETKDIADKQILVKAPSSLECDLLDTEHPVTFRTDELVVTDGETTLRNGIDYVVSYSDNTAPGTASYMIRGINGYSGVRTGSFELIQAKPKLASIAVQTQPAKTTYTVGEQLDPTGLVLSCNYSNNTHTLLSWTKETSDIVFEPSLETIFTSPSPEQQITVRYGEKSARFSVRVDTKPIVDPTKPSEDTTTKPDDTTPAPINSDGDTAVAPINPDDATLPDDYEEGVGSTTSEESEVHATPESAEQGDDRPSASKDPNQMDQSYQSQNQSPKPVSNQQQKRTTPKTADSTPPALLILSVGIVVLTAAVGACIYTHLIQHCDEL